LSLLHLACTEDAYLTDANRSILNAYGEIKRDTLYAIADSTFIGGKVNTGLSAKLLLGSYGGYKARFLIKFSTLPPDTAVVDTLRLVLRTQSNYGDSTSRINGTIYRVTETWTDSVNTDSSWNLQSSIDYSSETSLDFSISSADSAELSFNLPVGLVDIWRDTTAGQQNFGLLIDYHDAAQLIKFYSTAAPSLANIPKLIYIYKTISSDSEIVVHDTVYASLDANLIDFDGSLDPGTIYVGAGYFVYSFVKFDLSPIPEDAYISTVNFFFNKDVDKSITGAQDAQLVYLRDVTTSFSELPYFNIDSTFNLNIYYNLILTEENDNQLSLAALRRAGAGQKFLQNIINGKIACGSFYLEHLSKEDDIELYAIDGVENPEPDLRPSMVVEYYLSPKSRL
jgi:hypothetical protein